MKFYFSIFLFLISNDIWSQHTITRLPYPVNTRDYDEICPVFDIDEEKLFYTKVGNPSFNKTLIYNGEDISSNYNGEAYIDKLAEIYKIISGKHTEDPFRSTFNQDIWYTKINNDKYSVYHPGYPLNDALPNSICSVYGKENGYVLINQFFEKGGMKEGFSTVKIDENDNASFPIPFTIRDFKKISSEINLTMSIDKQVIIMAMRHDRKKDKDLYMCIKINDTLYSSPVPLNGVNTSYNETTPFISRDKKSIYFASDRPEGNGGLDIYKSERLDYSYKNWSTPTTYNAFLNTPHHESHPFITLDEEIMYYTSDKEGSSDIFYAYLNRDTLHTPITIKINVIKEETGKNHPAEINWRKTFDDEDWPNFWRSRDGYHEFVIDANEPYDVKAENRNFKSQIITIDPQELQQKGISEYYLELVLTKDGIVKKKEAKEEAEVKPELGLDLQEGKKVVLKNIYFKRAKPDVVPESFSALRILADVIKSRPTLIIQVEGHTDNVGDKQALMDLSIARAAAIKTFLISEGVADYQVEIIGYGGEKPLTDNSTEAHRRKNRRVEIRVLKQ